MSAVGEFVVNYPLGERFWKFWVSNYTRGQTILLTKVTRQGDLLGALFVTGEGNGKPTRTATRMAFADDDAVMKYGQRLKATLEGEPGVDVSYFDLSRFRTGREAENYLREFALDLHITPAGVEWKPR